MAEPGGSNQVQWLMRKAPALGEGGRYTVTAVMGPYLTSQIRSMVAQGMLDLDDEICPENGYWFLLSDVQEVRRQLGVEPPALRASPADEITQPDLEDTTQPELAAESSPPSDLENTGVIKVDRPHPAKPVAGTHTTPASAIGMQYSRVKLSSAYGFSAPPQGPKVIRVEKSKFWVILLASACVLALLGVLWAIRTLHLAE